MALDLDELTKLRDELIRARARGARSLQMGQERVEYRSDAEMAAAIASLDRQISGGRAGGAVRFNTRKGV